MSWIFVAGAISSGNHLWKVYDSGSVLSLIDSYVLPAAAGAIACSQTSNRLYVACADNNIYCYDATTLALVESWGSSGIFSVGASIRQIVVDSSDYLAIAHAPAFGGSLSLLDNNGTKLWTSNQFGGVVGCQDVKFGSDGNVTACMSSAADGYTVVRVSRLDGSALTVYQAGPNNGGLSVEMSSLDVDTCYMCNGYTTYNIIAKDGTSTLWTNTSLMISSIPNSLCHLPVAGLLVVPKLGVLNTLSDTTGVLQQSSSDVGDTFWRIVKNEIEEIFSISYTTGYIYVHNSSMVLQRSLQVSSAVLTGIAVVSSINSAPEIIDQSDDANVHINDEVELYVTAIGVPEPTYQWYKDGYIISGELSDILSFTVDENSDGTYTCVVTNDYGSVESDPIDLSIYPEIIDQSGNTSIALGQFVELYVVAVGSATLSYQWYKNNIIISGETSDSISFYTSGSSGGTYKCKVTNYVGEVDSDSIVLTIISNPYRYDLFGLNLDMDRAS